MLEYLAIFSKGGAVLWTFGEWVNVKGTPVNSLIQQCLLEDRGGDNSYLFQPPSGMQYMLKWVLDNSLGLVFVAAYQRMLTVPYVDVLLQALKVEFARIYRPGTFVYPQFDKSYSKLLARVAKQQMNSKVKMQGRSNGVHNSKARGDTGTHEAQSIEENNDDVDAASVETPLSTDGVSRQTSRAGTEEGSTDGGFDRAALLKKAGAKKKGGSASKGSSRKSSRSGLAGRKPRTWKEEHLDEDELDFSAPRSDATAIADLDPTLASASQSRMDVHETVTYDDEDDAALEAALLGTARGAAQSKAAEGFMGSLLSTVKTSIVGKESLSSEDVGKAVAVLQKRLQARNVSAEVAKNVCASVAASLEGRKLASFTGVSALVRSALEEAVTRVLSPKRSIDVLADIRASQARATPYSIVFVGVNGVGKSTNLAKIAYWLRQQNLRVMIAACDTFRSGAVEQLKTHCNRLGVPLFDRGYDKDPTNVAALAIQQAARDGIDVVLVDTAGRMQDNEPLMQALSMLINKNNPDLVLFVGEALVGNDGVNQLVKFNQRLADLSPVGKQARLIDGLVVSKYDAIGDKVGALLSMAYSSGAPIMFVGTGQTYVDLKRLDVRAVVKALLK